MNMKQYFNKLLFSRRFYIFLLITYFFTIIYIASSRPEVKIITSEIPAYTFKNLIYNQVDKNDQIFLDKIYTLNSDNNSYYLNNSLNENTKREYLKIINNNDLLINKSKLSYIAIISLGSKLENLDKKLFKDIAFYQGMKFYFLIIFTFFITIFFTFISYRLKEFFIDKLFKNFLMLNSLIVVIIASVIITVLIIYSFPAIKTFGLKFLFTSNWDIQNKIYGGFAFIYGTIITSLLAILFSLPFSLSISLLFHFYIKKGFIYNFLKTATELLSAIPSVIYGFWGITFLIPMISKFEFFLNIPAQYQGDGLGILTASIILSIMIIPYTTVSIRQVIELVPKEITEGAFSLGGTTFDVFKMIILPYTFSGIIASLLLSLGKALGETMAVTMLIGNSNRIPSTIFSTGNTISSIIVNNFNEADSIHLSVLIELGLILFIFTSIINIAGKYIINKFGVKR